MHKPHWISSVNTDRILYLMLMILLLIIGIVLLISLLPNFKTNDFLEYWSSSRLISSGKNPYDPTLLFDMQKQVGLNGDQALMFYLPPWVFPFIISFSIVSLPIGQLMWLLFNICILFVCIKYIWQIYYGSNKQNWLAWVISFTFAPTYIAIGLTGQISPLMLAGITGFLYFSRKPKLVWLAGVFASLLMIKPQVSYLFLLALFIWGIRQKQWQTLSFFFMSIMIESIISLAFNPRIFSQYYYLMETGSPTKWAVPTIGSILRVLSGSQHNWILYISIIPGLIWLLLYVYRTRKIDWIMQTPIILLVSLVTSVYTWTYDQVILLVPILSSIRILLASEKRRAKWHLFFLFVINLIAWILRAFVNDFWFFWLAPTLLIWYIGVQKMKIDEVQSTTTI